MGSIGLRLVTSPKDDVHRNLLTAATPWLGRYGAALFPSTAVVDEEFADGHNKVLGMEGNLFTGPTSLATSVGLAKRSATRLQLMPTR